MSHAFNIPLKMSEKPDTFVIKSGYLTTGRGNFLQCTGEPVPSVPCRQENTIFLVNIIANLTPVARSPVPRMPQKKNILFLKYTENQSAVLLQEKIYQIFPECNLKNIQRNFFILEEGLSDF